MINKTEIEHNLLQQAVIDGCNTYLQSLDTPKSLAKMPGFFHNKEGRDRAQKVLSSMKLLKDREASDSLYFVIALFTTSSIGLTTCISNKIISGQLGNFPSNFGGITVMIPVTTLSSNIISMKVLREATAQSNNWGCSLKESVGDYSEIFNNFSGVGWILKQISLDQEEECKVKFCQKYLNNKNNLNAIDPVEMEHCYSTLVNV